jgi:hypothetical protein
MNHQPAVSLMRATVRAAFSLAIVCACAERESDQLATQQERSDRGHLRPSEFSDLPASIQRALEQRGCVVPQSYPDSTPHNVVRGRFTSPDEVDIAVLCARDSTTTILVFRGASTDSVAELASQPHADERMAGDSAATFWHSRAIDRADSAYIRTRFERYGGPKPPRIDHEGINDIFVEKASVVWYWYGGRWLQLQGAD